MRWVDQKTYFEKVDGSAQKHSGKPPSRPCRLFWGPLVAILDFAGVAGGERAPPSPLGWYYINRLEVRSKDEKKYIKRANPKLIDQKLNKYIDRSKKIR